MLIRRPVFPMLSNEGDFSYGSTARIAKQVGEPISSYYFYRKEILEKIHKELEKE